MIFPWGTERRLNAYSDYFKMKFGERVQKITINAGFNCPNRDGTCGTGGCTFCDNRAFTPSYIDPATSVAEQIRQGMEFHKGRYRNVQKYLAYFQAYSNTYADLETLKIIYKQAIEYPGIVGIVVGTRPDCVDEKKLDYFRELSKRIYVVVEYGIESLKDVTLSRINRGHDSEKSRWAVHETASRGVRTGGHMMIGLPGEDEEDFMEAVRILGRWPLDSLKFHQLQLIRGTKMALEYRDNPDDFREYTMESYLELMVKMIEHLNPRIVVERIAGEVSPDISIREGWGVRYDSVLRTFENLLEQYGTWQGKYYNSTD